MQKTSETRTVHLKFSEDELKDIDNWRNTRRIRTRSEAIRQMIRIAISMEDGSLSTNIASMAGYVGANERSAAYGVPSMDINHGAISGGVPKQQENSMNGGLQDLIKEMVQQEIARALRSGNS